MESVFDFLKNKFSYGQKQVRAVFLLLGVLLSLICVFIAPADPIGDEKYPLESSFLQREQYKLQFAAFLDGHIALDAIPTEILAELENPYDPDERENADLHTYFTEKENSYLWDVAYYDGQYFSYFGIAPIITVYYPYYALTGSIPSHYRACLVLAVCACVFLMLAYCEAVFLFTDSIYILPTALGGVALFFASGIPTALSCSDNYYLAVISAICFSMASLFFGLFALRRKKIYSKCIFLTLCAICLTLTVWSRPSSSIMCLILTVPFLKYLFDAVKELKTRREKKYEQLIPCGAFLIILMLGASAVMYYNFIRFDSLLEFGAKYQLTLNDISTNTLNVSLLCESVFAYFLQNPELAGNGAFLPVPSVRFFTSTSRFIYCAENIGCLWFGLPFGTLFSFGKKTYHSRKKQFFCAICVTVCAFFVAFFNFCVGGVNLRYTFDVLPISSLVGIASLVSALSHCEKRHKPILYALFALLFALAILCGLGCAVFFSKAAGQATL